MLDFPPGGLRTLLCERGLGPSRGSWLSILGSGSLHRSSLPRAFFSPPSSRCGLIFSVASSFFGVSSSFKTMWSLGLFGCARTMLGETGDPKISLVFPPGGFMRGRGWAELESSKMPLSFPPGGFVLFGMFWGCSDAPKILDAIRCGLLEEDTSSVLPKRLLESPPGGFNTLYHRMRNKIQKLLKFIAFNISGVPFPFSPCM